MALGIGVRERGRRQEAGRGCDMAMDGEASAPRDEGGRGRPLVVTGDGELLDELLDLARAGGVELTVAVDALAAEDHWASAPLVMVGLDQADALIRRGLPRRLDVILVSRADGAATEGQSSGPWSGARALGADHVAVLPDARPWLVARLAECRPRALRHAAPVVAVVPGGTDATAVALGLALAGCQQGLSTLLVGTDPASLPADHALRPPGSGPLAILAFERGGETSGAPEAMAVALRAARHGRDLVVVDLPYPFDAAARLALSSADQCYLVVTAEVRACVEAARVAAAVRRHCPALKLVVRAVVPGGLRPDEIGEALDLPLAGVLPATPTRRSSRDTAVGESDGATIDERLRVVSGLCRRLLAHTGARRRLLDDPSTRREPSAAAAVTP